ncbi:CHAT domain-containing protein, partial [Caldilinea sp.]|uniref:nSTAND1 domain-containing NTPase n=1 Tax=Caldilinea sp. TaxID=2293560 RepID=UPI002CC939AA|nr:CHAT domain-containing protein [Caldilinea sp.]
MKLEPTTMNDNPTPIIFLAFANDYEGNYLPELPKERRELQAVLDQAQKTDLCELVLRPDATLDDLFDVFQDARYRGRIALFHFGGHAGSYELLLQTADGKRAPAYAEGLAAFLGRQPGLQLVFLNGCSTQPHVQALHAAGVPAVVATDEEIDDALAAAFAARFYKGLVAGDAFEAAFHAAEDACKTADAELGAVEPLPWALTVRPGAEEVLRWNLPEAAGDPLFGLPSLPPGDLPASPFRNILWFRREDAPIFFGRGHDIRDLYQCATAAGGAPIVLYYGQSGVGKSSLLAAGLLPRLEQVQTVRYARRNQELGLAGTLAANVVANLPGSFEASWKVSGADLLTAWRGVEAEMGKPLTVILDQVEEVYTRPDPQMPGEMADFLDALAARFGDPATRPQGRLILSFRKEWLAEIEKLLAARQLPHTKVFLQRLDRRGIIEAVTGPAHGAHMQRHFGLTVAEGLVGEIADNLLADPSSAVAPTLQILLSKLWDQAKERNYDHPTFDRTLYRLTGFVRPENF